MPANLVTYQSEQRNGPTATGLASAVGFYFCLSFLHHGAGRPFLWGRIHEQAQRISLCFDYLLLFLTAFCAFGEARYPFRKMMRLTTVRWVFLFLGVSCCSLFWTAAASLPTAIAYWCGMAADAAIVIVLFRAGSLAETSSSLMTGFVWGACAVAMIAWIMPAQSDLRLGVEDLLGPNQIGYLCAFAFFFAQYLMRERRGRFLVQSLLLAVTMLRTLSKTTIAAFLVGQGFLLVSDKSISRKSKVYVAIAAAMVVAVCWGLLTSYYMTSIPARATSPRHYQDDLASGLIFLPKASNNHGLGTVSILSGRWFLHSGPNNSKPRTRIMNCCSSFMRTE